MSIKLMAQVWERKLNKAEQSVLLAMADHAHDDGSQCYPSVDWVAWKTDYSPRQVQRTIKALTARGVLVLVRGYGRGRSNEYRIDLSVTVPKPDYVAKGDIVSPQAKHDIVSPFSVIGDTMSPQTDTEPMLKGDICDIKGDIHAIKGDIAMSPEPLEPLKNLTEEKEETHASDPLTVAWRQTYQQEEIPLNLTEPLKELAAKQGMAAAIHGIKASAKKEDGRNFRYIAECARNYVPPAPKASYATGNVYSNGAPAMVDIPGIHVMQPAPPSHPLPTSDPWVVAVAELTNLPWAHWLDGSYLVANGELAGEPLYRVVLTEPGANAQWLTQQAEPAIRKKLASVLGRRILLEIITAERIPA